MSLFSPKPLQTGHFFSSEKKSTRSATSPGEVVIVASEYNDHLVSGMIEHAKKEFLALAPELGLSLVRVPGAFEIPLGVQRAITDRKAIAVLALGVLLQGETAHADLIAHAVTKALMDLSLQYDTPVVHAVLLLDNEGQALSRCLNDTSNRGSEAAQSALKTLARENL